LFPRWRQHRSSSLLQRIRETIGRFCINSVPTFQDFDRLGRGFITRSRFHSAVSTLNIQITTAELTLIANECQRENRIAFDNFVEDLDATHRQRRRQCRPIEFILAHTPTGDDFATPNVADDLIFKSKRGLRTKVGQHSEIGALVQELHELDRLPPVPSGEIPGQQFRTAIGLSTYKLPDAEFDVISPTKAGYMPSIAPLDLKRAPAATASPPPEVCAIRETGCSLCAQPADLAR
jgi:hypothetical protein